ncbi:hypothetical protein KC19_12G188500 [Ceratodon purpureus]|uniref:Uncharacterized protein n=1 Tax=Ceratodon purpureus TaxID=3225 RepID=A0A8T0G9D9_CERPU|nr:hypothetical protein KC19_12G188500 [Ceratodon purpureus]KAG0555688.1 hypothetical protein KC19_12G188500 [Ceratodon purpureus]KAG0555689.1 hypothetical protein KC19_12G188500 [Ceratodon purpureus]KAG0555690.1 hypothetical protein KC19_12G188500 [Ceratodon purpureus]KAG0555691.1 hypothetical protein KC19_12G188500 [Ceratodon purpureus]
MERSFEKETSRRSWPWKKKSNDKVSAASDVGPSPVPSKSYDNHQIWEYQQPDVPSHQRQLSPMKASGLQDRSRLAVDEARGQWLQSEERAKVLSEKLSNALGEITSKDNLVKQHVKVAEEAVSGWEKAEAEAVSLKVQLDAALQQKLATEDRVAHLDGALKECMKQLRHLREENEQRIHDTLLKKTREYDKLRLEMEAKLAESSHFLAQSRSELLESRAEVTALGHALQERSRSIVEMSEAKGRAETEIKVLQVRLETMEKDNSQLKYEVHVLNKELDIRSQEREYERKAVELASKQHLESVKKIAKLEEECNRLRLLVRKKLPGPAAIQRMRMEVEGVSKDPSERRRRSMSRSGSNLDISAVNDAMQENGHDGHTHEAQMLAERVVAMDEEMKMLKETLSQRNGEIQSARLMCSKTTAQLSVVEDELKKAKQQNESLKCASNRPPSSGFSQDFASKKSGSLFAMSRNSIKARGNDQLENRRESQNFELMDDFAEMERLAMSTTLSEPLPTTPKKLVQDLEEALGSRTRELEAKSQDLRVADQMCQDLRAKLKEAENQLTGLRSQNASNEASIVNMQEQLDLLSQHERSRSGSQPKGLSGYTLKDILGRAKTNQDGRVTPQASSSEGMMHDEQASFSDAESKPSTAHLELAIAVRKIVHIVEMLAQTSGFEYTESLMVASKSADSEIFLQLEWENRDLNSIMRNLAHASNKVLQGKADYVDFTIELGTVLDYILTYRPLINTARDSTQEDLKSMREQCANFDVELDRLRSEKAEIFSQLERDVEQAESVRPQSINGKLLLTYGALQFQHGGDSPRAKSRNEDDKIEEELMVLSSPNPALRAASGELTRLRDRVAGLERELQGERQRNQGAVTKLGDLQHQVHREGMAVSSEMSGGSHRDLSSHSTSEDEDTKSEKLLIRHSMKHERQNRDVEAAALAECQRTILALGKQLKGLGTVNSQGQEERETSPKSANSSRSLEKMTGNMELLRWQTELAAEDAEAPSANHDSNTYNLTTMALREHGNRQWVSPSPRRVHRSPSPAGTRRNSGNGMVYPPSMRTSDSGMYSRGESGHAAGALEGAGESVNGHYRSRIPSPARSEMYGQSAGSVPGSPPRSSATTPWVLRSTTRSKSDICSEPAQTDFDASVEKSSRNSSSFSRFYSRTRSGSIGG